MAKVYFDGRIVKPEEALIPVQDRAVLFGEGAFETLRSYDYRYFRLDEHIERFFRNLGLLGISLGLDAEAIRRALRETVRADGEPDARIKFLATAGEEEAGRPRFFILTSKLNPFSQELYTRGARLVTSELRRNEDNVTTTIKSLAYLDSVWARHEALRKNGDEGFFLNSKGFVSEGASSNIFIVKKGVVRTPSLNQGVLPGVTRSFVLELAASLGHRIEEGVISLPELRDADEVFITASIKEIMPVCSLDGTPVGRNRKVTDELRKVYLEEIKKRCTE